MKQIENREYIKSIVEENGGKYEGTYYKEHTTHLVLGQATGDKFKFARKQAKVKIVKLAWIEQSVEKGYLLPEDDFLWVDNTKKSISTRISVASRLPDPNPEECSANTFVVEDTMDRTTPSIEQSTNAPLFFNRNFLSAAVNSCQLNDTNKLNCDVRDKPSKSASNPCAFEMLQSRSSVSSTTKKKTLAEQLQVILNQSSKRQSSTFDGCDFYLIGCPSDLMVLLKKCLAGSGGNVSSSLRSSVTHIVYGTETTGKEHDECDKHIQGSDQNIFKYDFDWLLNCLRQNKLINVQSNPTPDSQVRQTDSVLTNSQQSCETSNVSIVSSTTSQRKSRVYERLDETENEDTNFLNEYLSQKSTTSLSNTTTLIKPSVTISSPCRSAPTDRQDSTFVTKITPMKSLISTPRFEIPSTSRIELSSRISPDKSCTISQCPEMFAVPLEGCVITFSGYNEDEREQYKTIARNLGAVCQDVFSLRTHPKQDVQANTHLICDQREGLKYEKSVLWKLFSVDKRWLLDCQKQKKRLDESAYLTGCVKLVVEPKGEVARIEGDRLDSSSQLQAKLRTVSSYFLQPTLLSSSAEDVECRKINIVPQVKCDLNSAGIPIAWNDKDAYLKNMSITQDDTSQPHLPRSPLILLCGFTVAEKHKYSTIIEKLGGRLAQDKEIKHDILVTCETAKNEKFFTSLCSGKWIVHPDYLLYSFKKQAFLDPMQYEWGTNKDLTASLSSNLFECAGACPRWREEVQRTGHTAFKNHQVVIVSSRPNSFVSIINAGGGNAKPIALSKKDANEFTMILKSLTLKVREEQKTSRLSYILIDYHRSFHDLIRELVQPLRTLGVSCAPVEYISHFLLQYPSPPVDLYDICSAARKPGSEGSAENVGTLRKRNTNSSHENSTTPSKRAKN
jgi:hypothetical protein